MFVYYQRNDVIVMADNMYHPIKNENVVKIKGEVTLKSDFYV